MKAGGVEENRAERRRRPNLKNPVEVWRNRRQQNHTEPAEHVSLCEEQEQQEQQEQEQKKEQLEEQEQEQQEQQEQLEDVSRRLILREEQMFSQDSVSEEEEDQLQQDFESLRLQMWMAVNNIFTSSSSGQLKVLRSAVASIQQQEEQDRRWTRCLQERVPTWRPQKCLSAHNTLLQNLVESRLTEAAEDDCAGTIQLSTPLKMQVCRLGKRVKEDLLAVAGAVQDCYPPQRDILNHVAGLLHQNFSARLTELAAPGLGTDDCSYLLLWINHCYPDEILKHGDLRGRVKTACLGPLLLDQHLNPLEDQYLTHKEEQVKLWLNTALNKETEVWLQGQEPELIDHYCFSPLAIHVIQVLDGALTESSCVLRDQSSRITAHLHTFLSRYNKCLEEFVKGNHGNVRSVIKAHLVCEQQLRDYITAQTGSVWEQQRVPCLDALSALKDCGYRCLTRPIHAQLKVSLSQLWSPLWIDGSLPVVQSLLDFLNQQLVDLQPACRQALLGALQQDLVLEYVQRLMRSRRKSREQQLRAAARIREDARDLGLFFREGVRQGCPESRGLAQMLCSVAEVLRLQDPGSVQLEVVSLSRTFPDLSDAHVSALLSLKSGLSAANARSIRRSVEENRLAAVSTNQSAPFFSKVKVKWISNKINQMGLKP